MKCTPYYKLSQLENFYFEDNYVLSINQQNQDITFIIETVLTESSPYYQHPNSNEQYCYRKIRLCFEHAQEIIWIEKTNAFNVDLDGTVDYGSIDIFYKSENYFYLAGEWGAIKILAPVLRVKYQN